uniref:Uncharacterized protein n=1 Tax=Salix viminalis TaxID=40686 RepID=A0A6N2M8X4_SALVM
MDGNNSARGYSHRDLTNRMEEGSRFFSQSYYAGAAVSFRHARDASITIHGESSLECAIARYSHGLSLLCQIPVPINDPMAFVKKEVDYYSSVIPFPSAAFQAYRGGPGRELRKNSRGCKGRTKSCMVDHGISNRQLLTESKHTVCPGGGESNPQRYYFEASSIFDTWLGENSRRVADMYPLPVWCRIYLTITLCVTCVLIDQQFRYVKLLICLEGSDKSKAIACGYKAMSIYRALYEKLSSETGTADQRRGSSSVARTDPFIQPKRDVAQQLCNMIAHLAHKASSSETHSLFVLLTRQGSPLGFHELPRSQQTTMMIKTQKQPAAANDDEGLSQAKLVVEKENLNWAGLDRKRPKWAAFKTAMPAPMDGNNNARGYSYRDLTRRMEEGSRFFTQGYFADAATCFRHARDFSIQIHGESSLECAITRYSRGLSLLCQIPVPINDPMAFVRKEVDYYTGSALPFPSSAFAAYGGGLDENHVIILEAAKGELNIAWSIMEYRIDNYLLKANILSALGEVAYRIGESNPQRYYFEASSIFDTWLGENSRRVADMYPLPVWCRIYLTITLCVTCVLTDQQFRYVKLLICLEGSDKSKAIEFGYKAMFIYRALYEKLPSETGTADQRRGSSSVTRTDPFIQQKRDEAQQLCNMITNLAHKASSFETHSLFALFTREIKGLEPSPSLPPPQERTGVTPAGHRYTKETVKTNTDLEFL